MGLMEGRIAMVRAAVLALAVCLLPGCIATELTRSRLGEAYGGPALKRLLVAVAGGGMADRASFQRRMAANFRQAGVQALEAPAVPAHASAPEDGSGLLAEAERLDRQALFWVRVVGVTDEPPAGQHSPDSWPPPDYRDMKPHQQDVYWQTRHLRSHLTYRTVHLETKLYTIPGGTLIWSAETKTVDPANAADLADSVSREVIADLRENGLLAP